VRQPLSVKIRTRSRTAYVTVKMMEVSSSLMADASTLLTVEHTTLTMDRIRACPVEIIAFNAQVKTSVLSAN
jgi:hypothetical protein